MRLYLLLFLAVVNGGISTYRPWEESPCLMVNMEAFCQDKGLHQIPWALPQKIEKLHLSKNQLQNLTNVPLTYYTMTKDLDLSSNQISFIQPGIFRDMKKLQFINLSENLLDRLAHLNDTGIGPLPHAQFLDLSSNSLQTGMAEYFLQDAPLLEHLSLSGNSIMIISQKLFLGTPALVQLDLRNNVIMDIEEGAFEHLTQLLNLDLSMNSITCISDFSLRTLQTLDLSQNSIETFHTTESKDEYQLSQIDLSENRLLHFPIFPKVNNLKYINVSKNLIELVSKSASEIFGYYENDWLELSFQPFNQSKANIHEHAMAANLSKLTHLDLSYNKIETIPTGFFDTMISLKFLNVSRNCLQAFVLGPSNPLSSLVTLDLSYNLLQNISVAYNTLTSLQNLYLQNNHIHVVESNIFQGFPSLRLLDLRRNNISICNTYSLVPKHRLSSETTGCASFSHLTSLQQLYLADNMVTNLPTNAFHKTPLTVLDLSTNAGLEVKVKALSGLESSLEYLYLQGNSLPTLNIDFPLFVHLKTLNLSGNRLTRLPAWNGACSLENLDLRNNSFSNLQASEISTVEKTLKVLYLKGNPLSCCENIWISHMIHRSRVELPDLDLITCEHSQSFGYPEEVPVSQIRLSHCEKEDRKKTNVMIVIAFAVLFSVIAIGVGSFFCFRRQRFNRQLKP